LTHLNTFAILGPTERTVSSRRDPKGVYSPVENMLTSSVTADKTDGLNGRMVTDRIDSWHLAVDNV